MLWPDRYPITWKVRFLFRLMISLPRPLQGLLWRHITRNRSHSR